MAPRSIQHTYDDRIVTSTILYPCTSYMDVRARRECEYMRYSRGWSEEDSGGTLALGGCSRMMMVSVVSVCVRVEMLYVVLYVCLRR